LKTPIYRIISLFSGSKGNCTLVRVGNTRILIDAGMSCRAIERALCTVGERLADINAIFITHEHSDHINGVRVFAERHGIKVYASEGTLRGMEEQGSLTAKMQVEIMPENGVEAGGIFVKSFRTPHDSRESTGYGIVTPDCKRIAVATDIGIVNDTVMNAVYGSDLILLESNHDRGMLQNGPYPYFLKERILSDRGHLSNEACAKAAVKLLEGGTMRFVLGHLSKENNIPSLAYETTKAELSMAGATENIDYLLTVAGDLNAPVAF
jgi:phosphoribosyl 1,2-cyclic phosphodiesterase